METAAPQQKSDQQSQQQNEAPVQAMVESPGQGTAGALTAQGQRMAQLQAMADNSPQVQKQQAFSRRLNRGVHQLVGDVSEFEEEKQEERGHKENAYENRELDAGELENDEVEGNEVEGSEIEGHEEVADEKEDLQADSGSFQLAAKEASVKQSPSQKQAAVPVQKQAAENSPKQAAAPKNNTGLPDTLKTGIENLSGMSMDDVKVHYNSNKPAQLQAHAYAQGTDIHLGAGQEKHLPHEAWHVVQQKQGRVKPTVQMDDNEDNNSYEGKDACFQMVVKKKKKKKKKRGNSSNQLTEFEVKKRERERELRREEERQEEERINRAVASIGNINVKPKATPHKKKTKEQKLKDKRKKEIEKKRDAEEKLKAERLLERKRVGRDLWKAEFKRLVDFGVAESKTGLGVNDSIPRKKMKSYVHKIFSGFRCDLTSGLLDNNEVEIGMEERSRKVKDDLWLHVQEDKINKIVRKKVWLSFVDQELSSGEPLYRYDDNKDIHTTIFGDSMWDTETMNSDEFLKPPERLYERLFLSKPVRERVHVTYEGDTPKKHLFLNDGVGVNGGGDDVSNLQWWENNSVIVDRMKKIVSDFKVEMINKIKKIKKISWVSARGE